MAGIDVQGSQILDGVRDTKILRDSLPNFHHDRRQAGRVFPRTQIGDSKISESSERRPFDLQTHGRFTLPGSHASKPDMKLPTFDGSSLMLDFLDWFDMFEDYFEAVNPPDAVKCKLVASKLKGEARIWWMELQNHRFSEGKNLVTSWSRMRELLLKRFLRTSRQTYFHNQQSKQEKESDVKHTNCSTICLLQRVKAEQEDNGSVHEENDSVDSIEKDDTSKGSNDTVMSTKCLTEVQCESYINQQGAMSDLKTLDGSGIIPGNNIIETLAKISQKPTNDGDGIIGHHVNELQPTNYVVPSVLMKGIKDVRDDFQAGNTFSAFKEVLFKEVLKVDPSDVDFLPNETVMRNFDPGGVSCRDNMFVCVTPMSEIELGIEEKSVASDFDASASKELKEKEPSKHALDKEKGKGSMDISTLLVGESKQKAAKQGSHSPCSTRVHPKAVENEFRVQENYEFDNWSTSKLFGKFINGSWAESVFVVSRMDGAKLLMNWDPGGKWRSQSNKDDEQRKLSANSSLNNRLKEVPYKTFTGEAHSLLLRYLPKVHVKAMMFLFVSRKHLCALETRGVTPLIVYDDSFVLNVTIGDKKFDKQGDIGGSVTKSIMFHIFLANELMSHLHDLCVYGTMMVSWTPEGMKMTQENKSSLVSTLVVLVSNHRCDATWTGNNIFTWDQLLLSLSVVILLKFNGQPLSRQERTSLKRLPTIWNSVAHIVAFIMWLGIDPEFTGVCYPLLVRFTGFVVRLFTTLFTANFFEIEIVKEIDRHLKNKVWQKEESVNGWAYVLKVALEDYSNGFSNYGRNEQQMVLYVMSCQRKSVNLNEILSLCDGLKEMIEIMVSEWKLIFNRKLHYNLQTNVEFNLTRGRVILLEGWNDEHNFDTEEKFISIELNVVTILYKIGQVLETLKLFHKVVNGLDPPKRVNNGRGSSNALDKGSLVDELFE